MFAFSEISSAQRQTVNTIRKNYGHSLASHNFSSIYIWKDAMRLSICVYDNFFAVKCDAGNKYFFPCGDDSSKKRFINFALDSNEDVELLYMTESDRDFLQREFPDAFDVREDRDSSEYIYTTLSMATLIGGHYRDARKEINRLKREHTLGFVKLSRDRMDEVRDVTQRWNTMHSPDGAMYGDTQPALLAAESFETLGMEGLLMYVDGTAQAYIVGSPIDTETFDIQLAKSAFETGGLDHCCRQEFCRKIAQSFIYINQEEDLGMPGLRERKLYLQPSAITPVMTAKRRML